MVIWFVLNFRQNLKFGNLRPNFPSKGHIWTSMSINSGRKIIYGPYGPHISGGKSIYGPYGHIFWCEVQPQTHILKPNPKPIPQKPNPKPISRRPNPKTLSPNPIPNLHPKPNPEPISQKTIPNPYPKPISQTHIPTQSQTQSQTYIPNPIPNPIPNLYPKTQSQTYIPNPIPILECFSGRLRFPVFRFSGKGRQHDRGS